MWFFNCNKKNTHFWTYVYMNVFLCFCVKNLWCLSKNFRYILSDTSLYCIAVFCTLHVFILNTQMTVQAFWDTAPCQSINLPVFRRIVIRKCLGSSRASIVLDCLTLNHLTPNGHFSGRTAPLTYKCCNFYLFNRYTYWIFYTCCTLSVFSSSKCRLFHNATFFGSCIIHILYTGCANI
jgi:hypothetical protein